MNKTVANAILAVAFWGGLAMIGWQTNWIVAVAVFLVVVSGQMYSGRGRKG